MNQNQELFETLKMNPTDVNTILELLTYVRKNNFHLPLLVAKYGIYLIEHHLKEIKEHKYDIIEQIGEAAAEVGNKDMSIVCYKLLKNQFPGSQRVKLFLDRLHELDNKQVEILQNIIKEKPSNIIARKRELGKIKAKKPTDIYIQHLVEHLKIFLQDEEGWIELANQYHKINHLKDAIFCYEELILLNPSNPIYFLQLAELYYTMGEPVNIKLARSYYMRVTELNSSSVEAYIGICKCCDSLHKSHNPGQLNTNETIFKKAKAKVLEIYHDSPTYKYLEAYINSLTF